MVEVREALFYTLAQSFCQSQKNIFLIQLRHRRGIHLIGSPSTRLLIILASSIYHEDLTFV